MEIGSEVCKPVGFGFQGLGVSGFGILVSGLGSNCGRDGIGEAFRQNPSTTRRFRGSVGSFNTDVGALPCECIGTPLPGVHREYNKASNMCVGCSIAAVRFSLYR